MRRVHSSSVRSVLTLLLLLGYSMPAVPGIESKAEIEDAAGGRASFSADATVQAAGRGNPWVNLTDGRRLMSAYFGEQEATRALDQDGARGLSLASDDFDEDGAEDLVCGYAVPTGGLLVMHRGAKERAESAPFLTAAQVFELPEAAEFLGTGDFDADGRKDLVTASSSGEALYLLRGDGRGALLAPERIELPGRATALVAGEINRADGLADVVVGVAGREGPKALVFEGPKGALRQEPEVIVLPAEATSLAIGQLEGGYEYDLAVAAGSELLIVQGRDRRLSASETSQREVEPPAISRRDFPFNISSIAIGDFAGQGSHRAEIAVMSEDGRLQYIERADAEAWQMITEVRVAEPALRGVASSGRILVKAKVSSLATDDLIVIDRPGQQVHIVSGGPGTRQPLHETTSLEAKGGAAAVLPMRSHWAALSDLVVLSGDFRDLSLARVAPMAAFSVTNTNDSGPGSLRQAILDANANPGLDDITFNIAAAAAQSSIRPAAVPVVNPLRPLPDVSDPVNIGGVGGVIDPVSKKIVVTINGVAAGTGANGLTITAGNSVVKGLAIGNFNGHAISLMQGGNNMIMNNFLGTDETCTENRGNGGEGVNIQNSNGNTVMGNTVVFNADGGSVINSDGNVISRNNLGTDATMTKNKGNRGAGFGFAGASNTRFEFNRVSFNRLGFFGLRGTGTTLLGNNVMGNTEDGFFASDSAAVTIGGETRGAYNIFGGNGRHGVNLFNTVGTLIKANFFGTDPQGANKGNGVAGVNLDGTASMTQIGGPTPEARNTFAFSPYGIVGGTITSVAVIAVFNSYDRNTILAVDIGRNGPDSNDVRDLDRLSGGSLNSPELTSAVASGTETIIQGRLNSTPNRQFNIQYYWGTRLNLGGRGEGAPLGALQVTTDANGDASASARFTAPLAFGFVSALTTDLTTGDTSEFGNGVAVTGGGVPDLEVKKSGPETAKCREMVTYTITVRNVGTASAIGVRVIDTLPDCVEDEVEVIKPEGTSFAEFSNGVTTVLPRLDPGAPPVTITIKATLTEDCNESILNLVSGFANGDENSANNQDQVFTEVECAKIASITTEGKNVIVSGVGFVKGDQIDINGILVKTKFRGQDELLAKKGKKQLLACDPANPGRTNVIRLIRSSNVSQPIQDTAAFATCP